MNSSGGAAVFTRSIDQALDALAACRRRLPSLRDLFQEGSAERVALDAVLAAVGAADEVLAGPHRRPSAGDKPGRP
jgi:hypothetical protein